MSASDEVRLRLTEVRPCADDPALVHLEGQLTPPDPPLTDVTLDSARSVYAPSFRTRFIRGAGRSAIELEDEGVITVTLAESWSSAIDAIRAIIAAPLVIEGDEHVGGSGGAES